MKSTFFLYLLKYVFRSQNRQHLLVLAFLGLFFASFSLLAIQALMGGLQNGVVSRSKSVEGVAEIHLKRELDRESRLKIESLLHKHEAKFSKELVVELMLKKGGRVLPVRLHGIDPSFVPRFLDTDRLNNFIFPYDFSYRLDMSTGEDFVLIAPSQTVYGLSGVPRMAKGFVQKFIATNVPEVDQIDAWTRLAFVQNFLRTRDFNTIRIFSIRDLTLFQNELSVRFNKQVLFHTWEDQHRDLAWALNLESKMMFSLFISVIFLVSISIISGQLIFWSKIKQDLVGLWILGASRLKIFYSALFSFTMLNTLAVVLGVVAGYISLKLFGIYGGDILPDIFVERKVPVLISTKTILLSSVVPVLISTLFCFYTLKVLMRDADFLESLRG